MKNCEVSVFSLSSRAPSLVRKQHSQLIRHRHQTLACSFLISSLLNRWFISINLLLLCLCCSHCTEKKGTMCLIQCKPVRGMEPICILSHNIFSERGRVICSHILHQLLSAVSLFHSPLKQSIWATAKVHTRQLHFKEVWNNSYLGSFHKCTAKKVCIAFAVTEIDILHCSTPPASI